MTKQETIKQIDAYVSDYLGAPSHLFGLSHRTRADLKMLLFVFAEVSRLALAANARAEANGVTVEPQTWLAYELAADRPAWADEALKLRYQANCLYLGVRYS